MAKGYTQEYEIDFEEMFALVAWITFVPSLLAIATIRNEKSFRCMSQVSSFSANSSNNNFFWKINLIYLDTTIWNWFFVTKLHSYTFINSM